MAQGGSFKKSKAAKATGKAKRGNAVVKPKTGKKTNVGQSTKKGAPLQLPKNAKRRLEAKRDQKVTRSINANTLEAVACVAHRQQEKMFLNDIKTVGSSRAKEENRMAKSRKKSRVEEKLIAAKERLDKEERKGYA